MKETKSDLKKPYPLNLICYRANFGYSRFEPPNTVTDEMVEALQDAITHLTDRQKEVLRLRYQEYLTFKEISQIYNLSQERIRQLRNNALLRMALSEKWRSVIKELSANSK